MKQTPQEIEALGKAFAAKTECNHVEARSWLSDWLDALQQRLEREQ